MDKRPGPAIGPFTYLKDLEGYIYYARFPVFSEPEVGYSCVAVYFPDPRGERVQPSTGARYEKTVFQGLSFELPHLLAGVPKRVSDYLIAHSRRGGIFNHEFLFVPVSEIVEVYSPQGSLTQLLSGATSLTQQSLDSLHATLSAFASVGIPLGELGLYGGLQAGLIRPAAESQLRDIDVLVTGVNYYGSIIELARRYPAPSIELPNWLLSNPTRLALELRRGTLSRFAIPGHSHMPCDVRILRRARDPNKYREEIAGKPKQVEMLRARVIDAKQSLSVPFGYRVQWRARRIWVVGTHYRFVSAAGVGDVVDVRGLRIDKDVVLISHPVGDWINHSVA